MNRILASGALKRSYFQPLVQFQVSDKMKLIYKFFKILQLNHFLTGYGRHLMIMIYRILIKLRLFKRI